MAVNANGCTPRRYGLIGHPLGHSLSPFIHQAIMEAVGIEGTYELFDVRPDDMNGLMPRIFKLLDGFNVTIPYKERVLSHVRDRHPTAACYGAANTVFDGIGYNTDGEGFLSCGIEMTGRRVLLMGAGGVSRMMGFEAAHAGALSVRILARGAEKARRLADDIVAETGHTDIAAIESIEQASRPEVILNGTPLGMWPNVRGLPVPRETAASAAIIFDSIYNPPATRLLLCGQSGGASVQGGLSMLFWQAVAAQRIWNPDAAWDHPEVRRRLSRVPSMLSRELVRRDKVNYLFTGFMGCGKTTIGQAVADRIGLPFVDLDTRIRAFAGKSIPEIFQEDGEAAFRAMEAGLLRDTLGEPGSAVVATGGGALLQPGAMEAVDGAPALVVLLEASLERTLCRIGNQSGRPLLDGESHNQAYALFKEREPEYTRRADLVIGNNGPENGEVVAARIVTALGYGREGEET